MAAWNASEEGCHEYLENILVMPGVSQSLFTEQVRLPTLRCVFLPKVNSHLSDEGAGMCDRHLEPSGAFRLAHTNRPIADAPVPLLGAAPEIEPNSVAPLMVFPIAFAPQKR